MLSLNQILIQLNKAIECSNSPLPQEKGIAVILFDNLIEVQLYLRAEVSFYRDQTTWYSGSRSIDKKLRFQTFNNYDNLLKFYKSQKAIDDRDFEMLKYAHSIRNKVYHKGQLDLPKIEVAIFICFEFLARQLPKWEGSSGMIAFASEVGYDPIDFGQGLTGDYFKDSHDYFQKALKAILSKFGSTIGIVATIQNILQHQLQEIQDSIEFIRTESKILNFYTILGRYWYLNDVFFTYTQKGRKPKNLDAILILYAFLRESKDDLDDIPDLKIRQRKGNALLRKFRANLKGKYPHWVDLPKIIGRVKTLATKDERSALSTLIEIESKITKLYQDVGEASSELNFYMMELEDIAMGN